MEELVNGYKSSKLFETSCPPYCPGQDGGTQVNLKPRETVVLALTKPTAQIVALKSRGMLKIK